MVNAELFFLCGIKCTAILIMSIYDHIFMADKVVLNWVNNLCFQITKDVDCVIDCRAVYSDTRLYLFVVFNGDKSGYSGNMYQIVQQHLLKTLPSHYQPDIVTSVHSFPVNAHGRIFWGRFT